MQKEDILNLDNIIERMLKARNTDNQEAMELSAELILIHRIPVSGDIPVEWLIDQVVHDANKVRASIHNFDFAIWAKSTALELIDKLITVEALNGPSVDMNEDSHTLLESIVSRTVYFDSYFDNLLETLDDILTLSV